MEGVDHRSARCSDDWNRAARLIFAELKSHTGKPTERQVEWLDVLRLVPTVEVYVWRPDDWHELVEVLTGREQAA